MLIQKKGPKEIAKQTSNHTANSLRYVARDAKAAGGRTIGTVTANQKIIDGVITRAWQDIYKGNVDDVDALVADFLKKYKKTLLTQMEHRIGELTTQ